MNVRTITSIIAAPFIVIIYLNVEVLAESKGWDSILLELFPSMPDLFVQPWFFALATFVVGVPVGAWANWWASNSRGDGDTLGSLSIDIHNAERSIRRVLAQMPSGRNLRLRSGVPTSLPLDDAMRAKAVLAKLNKHGIPTPVTGDSLGFRASEFLADYFVTVYPFVSRGLKKDAKQQAANYLAKAESQSAQLPPKNEEKKPR